MLPIHKRNKEIYIISKLNDKSLLLAKSIRASKFSASIIFSECDAADRIQRKQARMLKCILRHEKITEVSLSLHSKNIPVTFILINDNEDENLDDALRLTALCRDKINAKIYSFNSSKESECLFDSIYKGKTNSTIPPVTLRRVNTVRNQVYYNLLEYSIFDNAVVEYGEKIISVLIVGMGEYGIEMAKALIWLGQMDGYVLRLHIIDKNPNIETLFYKECPGIRQRGFQPRSGEDYYEIYFYPGIDVNTEKFTKTIASLQNTTFAFVSLGNEQLNIETAMTLRSSFSGFIIDSGNKPEHSRSAIQTPHITVVVHSDDKAVLLKENRLSNAKGQYYQIDCIGADSEQYSFENVVSFKLEAMALETHMQWGNKDDFDNYEYNRRSSLASAIHKKYRDKFMPDGETKDILEHKRWNAYMRSTEGFSFGLIRDDLAHRHPLLVKYDHLSRAEKDKDSAMNNTHSTIF